MKNTVTGKHFNFYLLTILFFMQISVVFSQQNKVQKPDYENEPVWIQMMDDANVNYFEAIKAYETYWKHHKKPKGEEEEMAMMQVLSGDKLSKKEQRKKEEILSEQEREIKESNHKKYSKKEQLEISEREKLKYEVKRFENWKLEVMPFVQEDGRILTDEEKQAIWKKQQEELKNSK